MQLQVNCFIISTKSKDYTIILFICLFVYLFACVQDNLKRRRWIGMKLLWAITLG